MENDMTKNDVKTKKIPWGIFAAVLAMICSFLTVGIIAGAVLVVSGVGKEYSIVSGFADWWMVLLYVAEAVVAAGFIVCLVFYIRNALKRKGAVNENI